MAADQALESRYVDVLLDQRPLRIHYHDSGTGRGQLPPIVMLHGSGPGACGARNFSANIDHFLSLGFRLILIDWPGWGRSDSIVCRLSRSETNADILQLILNAIKLQGPFHLMGNSMGAHSATMFAIKNPGLIDKLILISGGNGGRSLFQAAPTEGLRRIMAFYQQPSMQTMRDFLTAMTYMGPSITEEAVQARFEATMKRPDHVESYCESIRINPTPYLDMSSRLPEISVPTLVFWGQDDRVVPLDLGVRVATLIPHADMHIFSQCGHVPHMEHASKFNHLVSSFLLPNLRIQPLKPAPPYPEAPHSPSLQAHTQPAPPGYA